MIVTRIYRLIPTAPPDDPHWGFATNQGQIIVRARSSGEARALAARAEAQAAGASTRTTTQMTASAFYQATLYGVRTDSSGAFAAEGERGVLARADLRIPPGYLVTHDD